MKKYNDRLLLEFLMFSKDINKDIEDFNESLLQMDNDTIYELIEGMEKENVYTEDNIKNLKIIIEFLKNKLDKYEEVMQILLNISPSNDIYYYEFLNKWEVLENEIENNLMIVSKKLIENSIRFDFYASSSLMVSSNDYVEKFLNNLVHNPLYLLFINKLMCEYPDALLNSKIRQRIVSILECNIKILDDPDMILYHQKLLKKVKYFGKNKKIEVFDYEKFEYHRNRAFIDYLITSNIDFEKYHDYLISDRFIEAIRIYIEVYDLQEMRYLFLYDEEMKQSIKDILSYILNYRQDNYYKGIYNMLVYKLSLLVPGEEFAFYENELMIKYPKRNLLEVIRQKEYIENDMKASLQADYYILEAYSLPEEYFKDILDYIDIEYYDMWFRKMKKLDSNFFYNEFLRKRTMKILEILEQKTNNPKTIQKMKKKIIKMNKELEY